MESHWEGQKMLLLMRRLLSPKNRTKLCAAVVLSCLYVYIFYTTSSDYLAPDFETGKVQFNEWENDVVTGGADTEKMQQVVFTMQRTFWKYRLSAWGYDDILPVSGGQGTSRNGWGAFIVDTSTTLALMGLWEELGLEVDHIIHNIDFTTAKDLVDPFETTIRYLGALVSLTDLIDSGVVPPGIISSKKRDAILAQASSLAKKLAPSFDSPTGMIWPRVDFQHDLPSSDPPSVYEIYPEKIRSQNPAIGPARAGSNWLENYRLSRLTGDVRYVNNATKAWTPLVWNRNYEDWPGLIDAPVDIFTAVPVGHTRSWDGSHDSYYEYLIKAHILSPTNINASRYRDRWLQAASSLRTYLSSNSSSAASHKKGKLFIGKAENGDFINEMGHLAHFAAGNLMLGGRYLGRPDLVDFGAELLESAHHTYATTATHIGPELFSWIPASSTQHSNTTLSPIKSTQELANQHSGYWTRNPKYNLRPEYVESLFYAYRITGSPKYRAWAWEAYLAIESTCRAEYGYAAVRDVDRDWGGEDNLWDVSESFWGAETLKYLYLIFADETVASLDEWVFNTEAHPLRRDMMKGRDDTRT
ncbi:MAG: hypothetical protein M1827_004019 [Pycnora praestabilis]|nr:MAG: hypothetical protein M1827_004019 [Pycnora praestabilis]